MMTYVDGVSFDAALGPAQVRAAGELVGRFHRAVDGLAGQLGGHRLGVHDTARHTGMDAAIYLQITRGGYTIGDWFVSYYVGENATYSVASHEGWHQYVARNFRGRLPPFLEEGTASSDEKERLRRFYVMAENLRAEESRLDVGRILERILEGPE